MVMMPVLNVQIYPRTSIVLRREKSRPQMNAYDLDPLKACPLELLCDLLRSVGVVFDIARMYHSCRPEA
jgi:hypothetical protein